MKIAVYSQAGIKTEDLEIPKSLEYEAKSSSICEYINYVRSLSHSVFASVKDRSQVSGGGKKPWKQKGTGHARHGSSRSPIWVGGGVTHGPSADQNHALSSNKTFRKNMKNAIFSTFVKESKMKVIDSVKLKDQKTSEAVEVIEKMDITGKITFFVSKEEISLKRAFGNLPYINFCTDNHQNIVSIISSDYVLITKQALTNNFK